MTDTEQSGVARGFLFADLRNYSAWVESHGDHAAARLLAEYRSLVRQAVADFHGAEIKTEGDSFYVAFGSPSAAVKCGLRILELAAGSQGAAGQTIPVGIGVHVGETVATDEGYVGSAVNVAARVCAQAAAGELLVTDAVRSLTRTFLDVTFVPRGRKRLKGISEPIGLYRVTLAGFVAVPSRRHQIASRWPIIAAVLAIPLLVVAIALIGGALTRETVGGPGSSSMSNPTATVEQPSETAAASTAPSDQFPTAAEAALVQLVPQQHRGECQRADPGAAPILAVVPQPGAPTMVFRGSSLAAVACDLGGIAAPNQVWYWELQPGSGPGRTGMAGGDPAEQALSVHAAQVGATPGMCRDQRPSSETWSFGGISGTLVCYETDEGDAVLLWAFDDGHLFGKAVRADRDMDALLDWWEEVGRFAVP